jgi:pimeloyl-ACP methyl ester carboxylesterase
MKNRPESGWRRFPTVTRGSNGWSFSRKLLALLLLAVFALGLKAALVSIFNWRPALEVADDPLAKVACWFEAPSGVVVDCYRLTVPETRDIALSSAVPDSNRSLALPVVIVRSVTASATTDPIVYLAGGPGDGAWIDPERITWWWDFIAKYDWLRTRDIILFDQRGSGMVTPRMDCANAQEMFLKTLSLPEEESIRLQREDAEACAAALTKAGFNGAAYTSVDNAADLHDLFTALKVPRWNVYGLSYGTRLALEYMRQHPDDIRSVILDSVLPPQAQFFEDDAANTNRAFQYLLAKCREDAGCNFSYPDLGARLLALVERLNRTPLLIERPHPEKEGQVTIRMDGNRLIYRFFSLLYNEADIGYLPRLIDAYDRNLESTINNDVDRYLWEIYGRADFGDAMYLSVQCFEEMPFNDLAKANDAYGAYPLLVELAGGESGGYGVVCDAWRRGFKVDEVRESDAAPVTSDIPTLIFAGSFDPVTPPNYARLAADTLKHSYLFEFSHLGHDVLATDRCAHMIAEIFLAAPEHDPTSLCAQYQLSPRFFPPIR